MAVLGRFYDGKTASVQIVELHYLAEYDSGALLINAASDHAEIARWNVRDLYAIAGRRDELRLAALGQPVGARVVVQGHHDIARIWATLPTLQAKQRRETGRQVRFAIAATLALAMVIAAYLYGVPLLANRIVALVPTEWEERVGATVASQLEASIGGLRLCDANPQSLANRALTRFGETALAGTGSPFTLNIDVVVSDIANAIALPGGQVFVFSALLDQAQSPDEFAGVLAHEIGHVARRDGMEQLISSAGTGALIGFILGDMTGISLAAGLGSMVVDARFSRNAEHQADAFAANLAQRLDFDPSSLADLLNRVGRDDDVARALALLSTHPLTDDRKAALDKLSQNRPSGLPPAFTAEEWRAIKTMCGTTLSIGKAETK